MAESSTFLAKKRFAVVTGSNKGIGFEICRQLASQGITVVLTSRDEQKGLYAVEKLKESGLSSENIEFHQLNVTDEISVASLADFIKAKFGKLDILVNNAGILGAITDYEALAASGFAYDGSKKHINFADIMAQTYELAEECLNTNYYGATTTTEALLPLLQLSDSPRIVNVSSSAGRLNKIPNQAIREILANAEDLTAERLDKIVKEYLTDFKDGSFVEKGWPPYFSAYIMSKVTLNAYTRMLAKRYPSFIINCLCPGYVRTEINGNTGNLTPQEGAARVVRLALMPHGSPSGLLYVNDEAIQCEKIIFSASNL